MTLHKVKLLDQAGESSLPGTECSSTAILTVKGMGFRTHGVGSTSSDSPILKSLILHVCFPEIELDFAVPLKDAQSQRKRQARFECVLTREANVIWSKGPDIIKSSDKFDIITDGKKHILVINDSQLMTKVYTAEVGKKASARLFVTGKSW